MNNKDMENFAKYFSHGVDQGVSNYYKGQAQAIADARNKIAAQDKAANDRYRQDHLQIMRGQLANQTRIADARVKKMGAGIGGPAGLSAQGRAMIDKYEREGADMAPPAAPPSTNVTVEGNDSSTIDPVSEGLARGGKVKKFARGGSSTGTFSGGIEGDMSLEEAEAGGPGGKGGGKGSDAKQGANMFSSSFKIPHIGSSGKTGAGGSEAIPGYGDVFNAGAQGSGAGGAYTAADAMGGGGLGDVGLLARRGGAIRRYARGGPVQAIDTGTSGPGSGFGVPAAPPVAARRPNPVAFKGGRHG
jgi:hypothetical protein